MKTMNGVDFLDPDCAHEAFAARALSVFFPTQVVAPVQRHASAKRLLCSLDEKYFAGLSDASKRSFAVQGGAWNRSEAMRLLALEEVDDDLALRRMDSRAMAHGIEVPDWNAFRQVVLDISCGAASKRNQAPWEMHTINAICTKSQRQQRQAH